MIGRMGLKFVKSHLVYLKEQLQLTLLFMRSTVSAVRRGVGGVAGNSSLFSKLDANKDGEVSRAEWSSHLQIDPSSNKTRMSPHICVFIKRMSSYMKAMKDSYHMVRKIARPVW